eukprot:GHVR01133912.1.p1 GENE.GHVR01133912.1~~GHVR01133912.1.p1  ORF type:complete len:128 (-),score=28.19 GHVR01133912.1:812-1195(-)
MKLLLINKIHLYRRFHRSIDYSLRNTPGTSEIQVELSEYQIDLQKAVLGLLTDSDLPIGLLLGLQKAVLGLLETSLSEIKKAKGPTLLDLGDVNVDMCLSTSFDRSLREKLTHAVDNVPWRVKKKID